jgi:hypothetical protein
MILADWELSNHFVYTFNIFFLKYDNIIISLIRGLIWMIGSSNFLKKILF